MRFTCILTTIIFFNFNFKAQEVKLNVYFNNSIDRARNPSLVSELNSIITETKIDQSLLKNDRIEEKKLIIQVVFYDRAYTSNLKLKNENEIAPFDFITYWEKLNNSENTISFLFVKGFSDETYKFNQLLVSNKLQEEYLFPLVVEFINSNLKGDTKQILHNGIKYLAKVLIPVWNDDRKKDAVDLIKEENNPQYYPNRINTSFNFSHLDFLPASDETIDKQKYKMVACEDKIDRVVSNRYIYTDPTICKKLIPGFYASDIKIGEETTEYIYFKSPHLTIIIEEIEYSNKHNPSKYASDYSWAYDKERKPPIYIKDFSGFRDRKKEDRLVMFINNTDYLEKNGQEISILSEAYRNTTWCNVFAMDLSRKVLFNHIPWGTNMCGNYLHYTLSNDKANFREVNMKQAWEYTMAGYVVYLTSFAPKMAEELLNRTTVDSIPTKPSGHIATCFPEMGNNKDPEVFMDDFVIQAGGSCGKLERYKCFGDKYDKIKAHIYLGYIIK